MHMESMGPELFNTPQTVVAVDRSGCYGWAVILTETLAIKCIKLGFVIVSRDEQPPAVALPPAGGLLSPMSQQAVPADIVFCEETLRAADTVEQPAAAPAPPPPVLKRHMLHRMPTPNDIEGAISGYWIELPARWEYQGELDRAPRFDDEISRSQLAAGIGVSPAYHGSCP